jgi:CBS domain-containing protein
MLVQQILKSKDAEGVITVLPEATVADAAAILAQKRIGTVVVSPDGVQAIGILSERDIVRELSQAGALCLGAQVQEYMTRDPVTCTRADTAEVILHKMTEGRFRHMPVVEDGRLIGLVTLGDVVKARLNELAMEKDALQGMIMGH